MWSNPQIQILSRLLKISLNEKVICLCSDCLIHYWNDESVTAWRYLKAEDTYICIFL